MKRLNTANQHQRRHQVDANITCPKERAINLQSSSSCGESSISIMSKQTSSTNMRSFNWRSNWETLLVFVIIVVGIVITTIAAIRSKDKHLLVIPDEQSNSGGDSEFGGDTSASSQVPPLPSTDFQMSDGGGIGGGEPPPSSLATRQKNARRQAAQTQRTSTTQKDASNSAQSHGESYGDDVSLADDFHATRSSLAPPTGGSGGLTELTASPPKQTLPSTMQGPYELAAPAPAPISSGGVQRPPNRPSHPNSGGRQTSPVRLAPQQTADHRLQVAERPTQPPPLSPLPTLPPPPPMLVPEDPPEDMMTSYTRLPDQSSNQSSTSTLGAEEGPRDFHLNNSPPNSTGLLATSGNKVQITEYSDELSPVPVSGNPHPHLNHHARTPALPFSLLLNDLIKMARPMSSFSSSSGGVGSTRSPGDGLEQPANSRPQSSNYGILQQMRSSFPAPLLALFQGGGASEPSAGQQAANHDASESSHYQRISMSPSESLGMMLSRTLRSTNPLPAYPPPKGTPQAWVHPNSGGTSVLNDAASNNADFVAGNTAGFLRADSLSQLTSGSSSQDQPAASSQQQQQQQQTSSEQHHHQQQELAGGHPAADVSGGGDVVSRWQQQQQQQQQQVGPLSINFMQQPVPQQQQQMLFGPGAGQNMQMTRPASLDAANSKQDDSYRAFKSAGALGVQQQHQQGQPGFQHSQQQLAQYPSIQHQQQTTFGNLPPPPPPVGGQNPARSQNQPQFVSSQFGGPPVSNPFTSGLIQDFQQQQQQTPVYNSRQIFSEIHEPSAHVPLGFNMPQQQQQQQQQQNQGQNGPMQSPLLDFNLAPGVESAPRASISGGSSAAKLAGSSSQHSGQLPPMTRVQQQAKPPADVMRQAGSSPPTTSFGGQQPITLNAVSRMRRSLASSSATSGPEDDGERETSSGGGDLQQVGDGDASVDDEEYLDLRPLSVVSPDGRPMSGRALKLMRQQPEPRGSKGGKGDGTRTTHQRGRLDEDAPMHHYASGGSKVQALESSGRTRAGHRNQLNEQNVPQLANEKRRRRPNPKSNKTKKQQVDESTTGVGAEHRRTPKEATKSLGKQSPGAMHLDTASSGLMSKLLGTASTNDELEDDPDGGGGGGGGRGDDEDDDSSAQERRKEELEDAEFGIVNEQRPESGSGGADDRQNELGSDNLNNMNEMGRLARGGGPSSGTDGTSGAPSMGSAGSTDNNAYASRRQQQQQTRSDVEFYGHPGEETRQLKYGILGSGNYEVVNGGIYPDTEESTAAVNSVANYVRKPGMLLAGGAGLPKLFGGATSTSGTGAGGEPQSGPGELGPAGFMPGGRMGGGFMRGASISGAEEMAAMFPAAMQPANNPLLDMLNAAHGASAGGLYPFDASLMSQLGGSGSSARTTHASQDEEGDDNEHRDQLDHSRAQHKDKRKRTKLSGAKHAESYQVDAGRLKAAASNGGSSGGGGGGSGSSSGKRDTMQPMESLSEGPNNRIRSSSSSSTTLDDVELAGRPAKKSQQSGTNQFYSYQLLPSKKVTIFSDQDLDSAPSEQAEGVRWHEPIGALASPSAAPARLGKHKTVLETTHAHSLANTARFSKNHFGVDTLHVRRRRRRRRWTLDTSRHESVR